MVGLNAFTVGGMLLVMGIIVHLYLSSEEFSVLGMRSQPSEYSSHVKYTKDNATLLLTSSHTPKNNTSIKTIEELISNLSSGLVDVNNISVNSLPTIFRFPYFNNKTSSVPMWKSILASSTFMRLGSTSTNTSIPNLKKQVAPHEKEYLKLHMCNAPFEAYSAAWLTTKEHMLSVDSLSYNLSWVNCEMASFIHMDENRNKKKLANHPESIQGLIMQSLDVLDFSVIHLSAYERGQKRYQKQLWPKIPDWEARKVFWGDISAVKQTAEMLASTVPKMKFNWSEESKRTIVIMPFLGGAMGAGHSVLSNRYVYLQACFWSIYKFLPNIIVSVTTESDVAWARNESGMPFYDVFLMKGLPKGASLPVGTTQETKRRLMSGKLDFDYIYYTESDQILLWRQQLYMYDYLRKFPGHMLVPHRLMAYPTRVMEEIHLRTLSPNYSHKEEQFSKLSKSWDSMSCCLPRQNCLHRKRWVHLKDVQVPTLNYMGIEVPLGNVNFIEEMYRSCKIMPTVLDFCP